MYYTCDPEGLSALMQYEDGFYPLNVPDELIASLCHRGRIPKSLCPEVAMLHKTHSLRELARKYGVSYETVRRALKRVAPFS